MLLGGHVRSLNDLDFLQTANFDFGELVLNDEASIAYWGESGIKNRFKWGFYLIAHGPREGPPNDISNLWDRYYPSLLTCIDMLSKMEIPLLTVHMWTDRRFVLAEVIDEKISALKRLVEYALPRQVFIALENLSEPAADLSPVLSAVPGLGITLDVGHAELLTSSNTSIGIIRECGPSIRHIHLHDNNGGDSVESDLHLPPGQGVVDFMSIFRELLRSGYDGTMTIEVERDELLKSRTEVERMLAEVLSSTDSG
jgi:sugar phosphate isomerase/epimerase